MLTKDRYEQETISHSGLNAFAVSPRSYRRYKDYRDSQTTSVALSLGSAVHCFVLEPEEFYDRYVLAPNEVPSPMYKKFIEELARTEIQGVIYDDEQMKSRYENAYRIAGFKNPLLPRVIVRYTSEDIMQNYHRFLNTLTDDKAPLSPYELTQVKTCKESTGNHKLAAQLLYGMPFADRHSEIMILWKYPGYDFTMRSILDRLVIDKEKKIAYMIDLKTTSKSVHFFSDSYGFYNYYR